MGKKSKSKKRVGKKEAVAVAGRPSGPPSRREPEPSGTGGAEGGVKSTNSAAAPPPHEPGPECWICLMAEPDDSGKPVRRDCSCRGNSGFAHLSCIIEYATQKSNDMAKVTPFPEAPVFMEPWYNCPNCKQEYGYHSRLALDLATAHVAYAEEFFAGDTFIDARVNDDALHLQLGAYAASCNNNYIGGAVNNTAEMRENGKKCAEVLLSRLEKMKTSHCIQTRQQSVRSEGGAYHYLGFFFEAEGTKQGFQTALKYYTKSRDIFKASNLSDFSVSGMEKKMGEMKAKLDGVDVGNYISTKETLQHHRLLYEKSLRTDVKNGKASICNGIEYGAALLQARHTIAAQKLFTELARKCQQVHGDKDIMTEKARMFLEVCKMRYVSLKSKSRLEIFQALRYQDGGNSCVIRGPNGKKKAKTIIVKSDSIMLVVGHEVNPGAPVICHGLKKATHLNGKIGDARSFDEQTGRFEVHFEEEGIKPVSVKNENVRILFDLPDKS